jgi:ABC-type uncharacterized transport system substrate-binding protein
MQLIKHFICSSGFRSLICALLLCLAPISITCWAGNLNVTVVLSDNSAPFQSFANTFVKSLPASVNAKVLETAEQLSFAVPPVDLIVTVGMQAAESVVSQNTVPVLAVMISQRGYIELLGKLTSKKTPRTISAIYLDQPWERQINFLRAALPERRKISLLSSEEIKLDVTYLRQVVAQRGGSLEVQKVHSTEELFPQLENVLTNSDVLLATPDSLIYNNSNILNILLTSYRYRVPIIGLSQAYVNAGALGAIFSTPEQLAEQAGATVVSFSQKGQLPEAQPPIAFSIALNHQVARSMGIELPSAEIIRKKMDKIGEAK